MIAILYINIMGVSVKIASLTTEMIQPIKLVDTPYFTFYIPHSLHKQELVSSHQYSNS